MGVATSCLNVGMTEHLLNHTQVGAGFEQVGRKTVAAGIHTLLINCVRHGSVIGSTRFSVAKFLLFAVYVPTSQR